MNQSLQTLFWDIMSWGLNPTVANVFHKIQKDQANDQNIPYQFPEPWNGAIENAPLIFVGLNPSFDPKEVFPYDDSQAKQKWWTTGYGAPNSIIINGISLNKKRVEDFFEKRFFNANYYKQKYVDDRLRVLLQGGSYGNSVKYWRFLENVMRFELNMPNAKMGEDCALLEIIPCKSKKCAGMTPDVIKNFVNSYFKNLLKYLLSKKTPKRTFVVFGKKSAETFYNIIKSLDKNFANTSPNFRNVWKNHRLETLRAEINNNQIKVMFSYHSSARNFSFDKYKNYRQP